LLLRYGAHRTARHQLFEQVIRDIAKETAARDESEAPALLQSALLARGELAARTCEWRRRWGGVAAPLAAAVGPSAEVLPVCCRGRAPDCHRQHVPVAAPDVAAFVGEIPYQLYTEPPDARLSDGRRRKLERRDAQGIEWRATVLDFDADSRVVRGALGVQI